MRQKHIIPIILAALALLVILVVTLDFSSTRPDRRPPNPFAFDISEFSSVELSQIGYHETQNIRLTGETPRAIAYHNQRLHILIDDIILVITPNGQRVLEKQLAGTPSSIAVSNDGVIAIAFRKHIIILDPNGEQIYQSQPLESDDAHITSVATGSNHIFAADAGTRRVHVYNHELSKVGEFQGESGVSDLHGFIIPSAHFALGVNADDELWVVNPGLHAFQNYTPTGRLRGYWKKSSFELDGFSGCCNPMHFAFLPNGEFVTSEKGLIRIKVHKPSGEFVSVVAPPDLFKDGQHAPPIATDAMGAVYALDIDRRMVRVFEPKTQE